MHKSIVHNNLGQSKVLGMNLIGLMVSSVLGLFILASIIKVIVMVNNNLQVIGGITELEQSATTLDRLLNNFFNANGYRVDASRQNTFNFDLSGQFAHISMWYLGDGNNLTCSGRTLSSTTSTPEEVTIFLQNNTADASANPNGFLACINTTGGLSVSSKTATYAISNAMPLVKSAQVARFYVAALVEVPGTGGGAPTYSTIQLSQSNPGSLPTTMNSFGVKLAVVLRTSKPVFSYAKTTSFDNILGLSAFTFTATDQYLYKLVTVEAPFVHRSHNDRNNSIQTSVQYS